MSLTSLLFGVFCSLSLSKEKPHILLINVDDLGFTDVGYKGAEYKTPTIDNLANNGIKLNNYHVHLDCSPTRSAILTGQYSFKNGLQAIQTVPPASKEHIPFDNPTLAELLKKEGYSTNMIGKWHLGYAAWNMTPTGRGFDDYVGYMQGAEDYYTHIINNGYDFWHNKEIYYKANNSYGSDLYYDEIERVVTNHTNSKTSEPLFLYAAFQTVHTPIQSPPENASECESITNNVMRKIYCNKMLYLDNVINNVVNLFKSNNLWDNTVLFFTTDNGGMPHWSDANNLAVSWGCNEPLRAGKATLFEGGVRGVGFINGGNNIIPTSLRGTSTNILTHAIDILPTLVEGFSGGSLPRNVPFDGINMWNTINGGEKWTRDLLYLDIEQNGNFAAIKDLSTGWKYIKGNQLYNNYYPCINGNYTPYGNSTSLNEYLFNITNDPNETKNLALTNRDVVNKYEDMIQKYIKHGGYMHEQSPRVYPAGLAQNNAGVWAPWLD